MAMGNPQERIETQYAEPYLAKLTLLKEQIAELSKKVSHPGEFKKEMYQNLLTLAKEDLQKLQQGNKTASTTAEIENPA